MGRIIFGGYSRGMGEGVANTNHLSTIRGGNRIMNPRSEIIGSLEGE